LSIIAAASRTQLGAVRRPASPGLWIAQDACEVSEPAAGRVRGRRLDLHAELDESHGAVTLVVEEGEQKDAEPGSRSAQVTWLHFQPPAAASFPTVALCAWHSNARNRSARR
jgi:hypothetical protein